MAEFRDAALDGRLQEEGGCAADAPVMSSERTPEEEFLASVLAGRDLSDLVDPVEVEAAEQECIAAMTPEERAAHFERCALETVFDDIRLRARSGELTTPDYWESVGLVPDHMEPSAFTALVFDTVIDAQARSEERAAAEQAFSATDSQDASNAAETAEGATATAASDDDASATPASGSAAARADGEAPQFVEAPQDAEAPVPAWELDDIAVLEGSQVYLYSTAEMSDSFARWAFLAAENDDVATLVENARHESKIYPRPMKAASLKNRPVYMTDERIEAAFSTVQESGLYPDIKTCSASNGDVYFYSTDHLSDAQAKALAEWESVERRANM